MGNVYNRPILCKTLQRTYMLQNICKTLGYKKTMVYNTPHIEKGRYTISDSLFAISFSSGWSKLYSKIMKITAENCFNALWL